MDAINLQQVVSTAAVSCALTAASLLSYSRKFGNQGDRTTEEGSSEDNTAHSTPVEPRVPASISEIWSTAWAAFDATEIEHDNKNNMNGSRYGSVASETLSQPLLWLQGIRPDDRRAVLSLSLSTLRQNIESLPLDTSTVTLADSWPRISRQLLASCTVAVAQAWLGYVPSALQSACLEQIEGGLDAENEPLIKGLNENEGGDEERKKVWYALEERLQLYCSVFRLLRSTLEVASEESPETASSSFSSNVREHNLDNATPEQQQVEMASGAFHRSEAVRGWSATEAGTRSSSQLLSLAPSILQDMAVMIADAVAGAYLAEASQGTWQPARQPLEISSGQDGLLKNIPTSSDTTGTTSALPMLGTQAISMNLVNNSSNSTQQALENSWWPAYVHPRLSSTRQLQRFSNRLAASRWIDRTFFSVAAAYEDRLPLFTLVAPGAMLRVRRVPVRRTAEISGLTGLRYAASLLLEAVDMASPVLLMLWQRAVSAVAWLLVNGVGWGMGLVWRGIKMGNRGIGNNNSTIHQQPSGQSSRDDSSGPAGWATAAA